MGCKKTSWIAGEIVKGLVGGAEIGIREKEKRGARALQMIRSERWSAGVDESLVLL